MNSGDFLRLVCVTTVLFEQFIIELHHKHTEFRSSSPRFRLSVKGNCSHERKDSVQPPVAYSTLLVCFERLAMTVELMHAICLKSRLFMCSWPCSGWRDGRCQWRSHWERHWHDVPLSSRVFSMIMAGSWRSGAAQSDWVTANMPEQEQADTTAEHFWWRSIKMGKEYRLACRNLTAELCIHHKNNIIIGTHVRQ